VLVNRARERTARFGRLVLLAALTCTPADPTDAEPVYSHLRIIAPAAPGGGWDQTARAMQQALQTSGIATTVSVDNIPGAAGTIGLAHLIGAERGNADVAMISGLIMLGAIVSNHAPVTLRDVTPIARLTGEFEAIVVPRASPYRSLTDLLTAFRAHPESISWAGGSAGGTDQILAGLVADAVGVSPRRVNYVAFAGGGESIAAILGGQVTAGISGLGEFAPQIAAGTMRILAVSSGERLPGVSVPTLREQGVDVTLENWRSLVAPPNMPAEGRARLDAAVAALVASVAWKDTLRRFQWNDRYLAGDAFSRFLTDEEARVQSILEKLGTTAASAPAAPGYYPVFVIGGWTLSAAAFAWSLLRARRRVAATGAQRAEAGADARRPHLKAMTLIAIAIVANVLLIERAGFVLASIPLFWLTARAFDARRPARDFGVAAALSIGAYFVFARLLQMPLPPGVLADWF
jgi:putative tricarboxylic transport membrane protein